MVRTHLAGFFFGSNDRSASKARIVPLLYQYTQTFCCSQISVFISPCRFEGTNSDIVCSLHDVMAPGWLVWSRI